jgi:O-antigen ligase
LPVLTALSLEVVGLAPSLTKTIWIAAFIAGVIASGLRRRVNSRTVLVALYAAGVLGVVYSLLQSSPIVAERVTGSNANFVTRLGDYVQGIYIFEHWPLTGAGIQQFIPAQSLVAPVTIGGVPAGPSAHNTFISVLAETGLLGFLPLLFLVSAVIITVRAVRRRARTEEEIRFSATILAAVVGYFLLSLTLVQIYYPTAAMLLALMLGAAAARLPSLAGTATSPRLVGRARSD